jgi:hypothetical protein
VLKPLGGSNPLVSASRKDSLVFLNEVQKPKKSDSQSSYGLAANNHVSTALFRLLILKSFWKGYVAKFLTLP